MKKIDVKDITYIAVFAALCYVGTLIHININIGPMKTMFHLGNIFVILGGVILGGLRGGIAGAIGCALFDATNGYMHYVPSTIILKFCMAFIAGTAFNYFKTKNINKNIALLIPLLLAAVFNIVFDPLISSTVAYFVTGKDINVTKSFGAFALLTTSVNALIAVVCSFSCYKLLEKSQALSYIKVRK